ncbi:hypothetical protein [Actinomadura rayongensis]|uniref:Glycerophosphoryl diester phosphodiesterase membrane domain-containing protein n=1 Tax=Actinomadura rayongensis TaxID=1429076 RepID=A0A6I4W567_9ACTN|nr:hypothetical protein [Actinomadura rayongensis]MXQ64618.1 hypothetical protein [Actinomadura rayongensis]
MPRPAGRDDDPAALLGGDVPLRPMSVAEILDGAVAAIRRAPRLSLGFALAVSTFVQVLVTVAAYFFVGDAARDERTPAVLLRSLGAQVTLSMAGMVLSAFGILVLAGFLAPALGREMFGRPAPGRALRDVRPRLFSLLGTALLVMAAALAGLLVPTLPMIAALAAEADPPVIVATAVFGVPVGLVLMIWLYVLLVQAVPAAVLERRGVAAALARGRTLARGGWWRTCATLVVTLLLTIFMGFLALRLPFIIVSVVLSAGDPSGGQAFAALVVDTVGRIVSWSVVLPFDAGVIVLLYLDGRMRREGFDLHLRTRPDAPDADFFDHWQTA